MSAPQAFPESLVETILAQGGSAEALSEWDAKQLLAALGIRVPRGMRLEKGESFVREAAAFGPPFVLKALSPEPIHKSDIGAVRLGLADAAAVQEAMEDIGVRMERAGVPLSGFLLEEMAQAGTEIVIGGTQDPQFGPMLMLGAGGIHAEVLRDTVFRLCPITRTDAESMLDALRIAPILRGARGRPPADQEAIIAALLALGGADGLFVRHAGRIREFDCNPLIARPDGLVAVDARIVLAPRSSAAAPTRPEWDPTRFSALFQPRSIAVVGASATGTSAGNRFIRILREHGYPGRILPIHPTAKTVEGLPAFPALDEVPEPVVDYAYLTLPAAQAEAVLRRAGGRLRFAQVMASGDPDTHKAWEGRLQGLAEKGGFRIIGPNCMGTHAPRGRFTFMEGVSAEPGPVGVACQSGGLGMDILRRGEKMGLRFSGLVTLGNSVDVDPCDLFAFFLADAQTRVIGLYVEDIKDGARFRALADRNQGKKPVVVLVGGLTKAGQAAAASHTGALAGSGEAWRALAAQAGLVLTETLDEFLDALLLCAFLEPKSGTPGLPITLFGNGGGTSVLATDALEREGFTLAVPPPRAQEAYRSIALPPGASLANPIDLPASVLKEEEGRIAARILAVDRTETRPYATLVHLNLPVLAGYRHVPGFLPNLMDAVLGSVGRPEDSDPPHRILVLRSDRGEEADGWRREFRAAAVARGVPAFDEIPQAIGALAKFSKYEVFSKRLGSDPRSARGDEG